MRHSTQNNLNGLGRFVSRLAAERNKTIVVFCLVAVTGFMWVRVLTGRKTPVNAQADLGPEQTATAVRSGPRPRLVFIELPNIKGRNDVLVRDFFSANRWKAFTGDEDKGSFFGE